MPLLESQQNSPGAKTIAGGTIGATIGMQSSNAIKELMKDEAHSWGRYFKNKPMRRALLGGGITASGFLGGLAAGSKLEKKNRKSREASTLLKQSSLDKGDAVGAGLGVAKGVTSAKMWEVYKRHHGSHASKKSLIGIGLAGAGSGVAASQALKKALRHDAV